MMSGNKFWTYEVIDVNSRFLVANAILTIFIIVLQILEMTEALAGDTLFACLHIAFGIYTAECIYEVCHLEEMGVFSYTAIFLVAQFIGQVFIGNFSYLLFDKEHNDWLYMNKAMLLCFLSVLGLTLACHMRSFASWGQRLSKYFFPKVQVERVYTGRCVIVFVISFSITVLMSAMGLLGYADANALENQTAYVGFEQYIGYIVTAGSFVLYLFFYEYLYSLTGMKRNLFFVFFVILLCIAITSGMKKDTLVIFLCLFLVYYLVKRRISGWFLLIFIGVVFGLYQFIDAYRIALRVSTFSGNRLDTFISVISGLTAEQGLYSDRASIFEITEKVFSRLSLVDSLSLIIEYKDTVGLVLGDPTFLQDWLLTPFTIFLPRFLFPFKAMSTYGLWVTHNVMGLPETVISASYVTVEGFFYLAGGAFMVLVGFFIVGIVFNFCGAFCRLKERNPVFIIVFFLIITRIVEPSTPIDVITDIVRLTIIYTLLGMFLVRMRSKS